jgi:fatty-acyl-CoA synthase
VVSMDRPRASWPGVLCFWDLLEGVPDTNPGVVHDDCDDCLLLRFTGGTTGAGKCVMYSIDNWMAGKDLHFALPDPLPSQGLRFLHFGMISHASGMLFFPVLFKGGCTVTMNDRSLATWCRTLERERITGSLMVPAMLYRLLEWPDAAAADLSSLRVMYYGAAPMSPSKLRQLRDRFGDIFVQMYGSSEHPVATTSLSIAQHAAGRDGSEEHLWSAGKVVPGVELRVVGPDGQPAPEGTDGELWMRSRGTCLGYLDDPDRTAQEFCDRFWKSGDVGRIDANGFVYVVDRMKDTIVSGGEHVYPSRVEGVIMSHPAVSMVAVIGIPHATLGDAVHAEVVLRAGASATLEELEAYLLERLPAHERPKTIRMAPGLPMSPVGKVLRRAVRDACRANAPVARA